jgi:hypothetical protein
MARILRLFLGEILSCLLRRLCAWKALYAQSPLHSAAKIENPMSYAYKNMLALPKELAYKVVKYAIIPDAEGSLTAYLGLCRTNHHLREIARRIVLDVSHIITPRPSRTARSSKQFLNELDEYVWPAFGHSFLFTAIHPILPMGISVSSYNAGDMKTMRLGYLTIYVGGHELALDIIQDVNYRPYQLGIYVVNQLVRKVHFQWVRGTKHRLHHIAMLELLQCFLPEIHAYIIGHSARKYIPPSEPLGIAPSYVAW